MYGGTKACSPGTNPSLSLAPFRWFIACGRLRQTPVMDLHQGDNEYNPLRTKPVTAAKKQEQKHIESSVYDPSTGKTVVSWKER